MARQARLHQNAQLLHAHIEPLGHDVSRYERTRVPLGLQFVASCSVSLRGVQPLGAIGFWRGGNTCECRCVGGWRRDASPEGAFAHG